MLNGNCSEFTHPDSLNLVFSTFIILGILISYLPQHIRIISRESALGLSSYYIFLGCISATCSFVNILLLPQNRLAISCCRYLSPFDCTAALIPVFQLGVQWCCFFAIMLLINLYPSSNPVTSHYLGLLSILHLFITGLFSLNFLVRLPTHYTSLWANILGVSASIIACLQYFPQILMSWKLKSAQSLSIQMMCIQVPGSFIWALDLILNYGLKGWSVWTVLLITGALQGALLFILLSYEHHPTSSPTPSSFQDSPTQSNSSLVS